MSKIIADRMMVDDDEMHFRDADAQNKLKNLIVQEKGNSKTAVMSQAAATKEFDKLSEEIGNKIERAIIQNGNSFINYSTTENTLTFPANITFIANNYHFGFPETAKIDLLTYDKSSMQVVLLNKTTNAIEVYYYTTFETINKSDYLLVCGIRLTGTYASPALDIGVPYTIDGDLFGVPEKAELSSPKWIRSASGMPSIVQEPDYTTTLTLPKGGAVMYADKVMVFADDITLEMLPKSRTNFSIVYLHMPDNSDWENNVTAEDFIVISHYQSPAYANRKDYRYVCNVRMEQGTAGPSTDIGIPWMWNGVLYDVVDDTLSKSGMPADAKKVGDEISMLRDYVSTVHITENATLYPIYLEAGAKITVKTADGSNFGDNPCPVLHFYNKNKESISNSGWMLEGYAYGNKRDITIVYANGETVARYCSMENITTEIIIQGEISQVSKNITELYNEFLVKPYSFSYVGEKIPSKVNYFDSELFHTFSLPMQDIEIYDRYLFCAGDGVECLNIYDLASKDHLANLPIAIHHGNAMQFSGEYYEDGDKFPLLYIGGSNNNNVSVLRLQNNDGTWNVEVVRTLYFPFDHGWGISPSLDAENNILYGYGYARSNHYADNNYMILTKWDLNRLEENDDGTFTPVQLSKCTCPYVGVTQGRKYYQGNIYMGVANTSTPHQSKMVVIDAGTGDVKTVIDMTRITTSEAEGLCYQIVGEDVYWYFTDYWSIFKLRFD